MGLVKSTIGKGVVENGYRTICPYPTYLSFSEISCQAQQDLLEPMYRAALLFGYLGMQDDTSWSKTAGCLCRILP